VARTSADASKLFATACLAFGSIASMNTFIIAGRCEGFDRWIAANPRSECFLSGFRIALNQ
jgi:hypothetical protein